MLNTVRNKILELKESSDKFAGPVLFNILGTLFGILSTVIIVREFGSDKLGIVSYCIKIITILSIISLLGFRQQIIKNISILTKEKKFKTASLFLSNAKCLTIISSLILVLFVFITMYFFENVFQIDKQIKLFLQIFVISLFFNVQTKLNTFVFISLGNIKKSVLFDGFYNTFLVFVFLIFAVIFKMPVNIETLAVIYLLSRLVNYAISFFSFKKIQFLKTTKSFDLTAVKKGRFFFYSSIMNTVIANIDIIIIGTIISFEELAIYSVCTRITKILQLISQVFSKIISPQLSILFYEKKVTEIKSLISKYVFLSLIISVFFFSVTSLFANQILSIWRDEFSDYSSILIVMVFTSSLTFVFTPYSSFLSLTGNEKLEYQINFYTSVFYIICLVFLTMKYGLLGSCIGFLIKYLSTDLIKVFFTLKSINK